MKIKLNKPILSYSKPQYPQILGNKKYIRNQQNIQYKPKNTYQKIFNNPIKSNNLKLVNINNEKTEEKQSYIKPNPMSLVKTNQKEIVKYFEISKVRKTCYFSIMITQTKIKNTAKTKNTTVQ